MKIEAKLSELLNNRNAIRATCTCCHMRRMCKWTEFAIDLYWGGRTGSGYITVGNVCKNCEAILSDNFKRLKEEQCRQ